MLALALDASQITEYAFCPLSWYLRYRENLAEVSEKKEAIELGNIFHLYLAKYYEYLINIPSVAAASRTNEEMLAQLLLPKDLNIFCSQRFVQYYTTFGFTGNDFTPSKIKDTSAIEIGFSKQVYQDENFTFIIEGRIDLIGCLGDKVMFIDHKTQGRKSNLYQYKTQFLTYALATELEYGLINYIGMTKEINSDTFRRQVIRFPAWMVQRWKDYIIKNIFFKIAEKLVKYHQIYENPNSSEGLIKVTREFERAHFESERKLTSCSGAFDANPCMFTKLCETEDKKLRENIKTFSYYKIEPWTPWKETE